MVSLDKGFWYLLDDFLYVEIFVVELFFPRQNVSRLPWEEVRQTTGNRARAPARPPAPQNHC